MDIAFVIDHFDPARGGAERYLADVARRLAARGHAVTVYCMDAAGGGSPGAAVRVVALPPFGGFLKTVLFYLRVERLLREARHGIVHVLGKYPFAHANVFQPHGGVFRRSLMQNRRSHRGLLRRGMAAAGTVLSPKKLLFLAFENRQYRMAGRAAFVAISPFVRDDMTRFYGVGDSRIDLVWNPSPVVLSAEAERARLRAVFRKEHGLAADDTAALFAAHNFRLKGLEPLIDALGRIVERCPGFRLIVAGGGPVEPYRRHARRRGVEQSVVFCGAVPDMTGLYCGCDLFVLPTFFDPCSLAAIEALAYGLPVVTTVYNGAAGLCAEGLPVVTNPWDADELAAAVLAHCGPFRRKGPFVRSDFSDLCDAERHVDRLLAIYDGVLAKR